MTISSQQSKAAAQTPPRQGKLVKSATNVTAGSQSQRDSAVLNQAMGVVDSAKLSANKLPYRVFSTTGQWYFELPQGARCGPYANQLQADVEAGLLWQQLLSNPGQAQAVIDAFCSESAVTCDYWK